MRELARGRQDAGSRKLGSTILIIPVQPTVEMLEAVYTVPDFPSQSPVLATSLMESGKSRADLWALAAIVAVEYGIETNDDKCRVVIGRINT